MRSVIIGPENTPYEDAPFVIDWMLDSNFPQTPPIAHFLSWTNGNGRGTCFCSISMCSPIPTNQLLLMLSEPVSDDIAIRFMVIICHFAIGIFTKMAKSACPFSVLGQAIETRPGVQQDPHCFRLSCLSKAWCWSRNRMPLLFVYVKHYHSCPSSDGFANLRTRNCGALRRELSTGKHPAWGVS